MVTLVKDNTTVELNSLTYSLKSRISGYLADDIDRSQMRLWILLNTKSVFAITISKTLMGSMCIKVEMDSKTTLKEHEVSLEKIYENITNFLVEYPDVKKVLLDGEYKVFAICNDANDFVPYKLSERKLVEVNINNVYPLVDSIQKVDDDYFICAFPDILFSVDKYTTLNLICILVKYYVETRFPVIDKNRLEDKQIISLPSFTLWVYHIKSLLKATCSTTYSVKNYYDNMSKMNMLAHVPANNWWIEESTLKLDTKRLMDFIAKKESNIIVVKDDIDMKDNPEKVDEIEEIVTPYIPEYFSHAFMDDDLQIMEWRDFLDEFNRYESSYKQFDRYNFDIFVSSIIIVPTENIGSVDKNDIIFLGFDGGKFYLTINSKEEGKALTSNEVNLKNTLQGYFWRKFGYEVETVFETMTEDDTKNCNVNLSFFQDGYIGE